MVCRALKELPLSAWCLVPLPCQAVVSKLPVSAVFVALTKLESALLLHLKLAQVTAMPDIAEAALNQEESQPLPVCVALAA